MRVTCGECLLKSFEDSLISFAKKAVEKHNMIVVLWSQPMEYMHPNMETLLDILEEMGLERYIIEKMDDGMFDESQVLDLVSDIDFTQWSHADLKNLWNHFKVPILRKKTTFTPCGLSAHVRMTAHDPELGKEE